MDLAGINVEELNGLAALKLEVALDIPPTEFARRASTTISAQQAAGILDSMGLGVPAIPEGGLSQALQQEVHLLKLEQIETCVQEAMKRGK
ncbi:hypothetical protein [Herpetosiphon gulosus]|uniref:Uncharacterized protein n=1 Tax=Herpetosiphon gulosus TaxID=1973496 RepID=A0ABP9WUG7_9CHLR